jgi:hypothetical protein
VPPYSTVPHLADLDPVSVARGVVQIVGEHLAGQAARLAPCATLDLRCPDHVEREQCNLGATVESLVRWAQNGDGDPDKAWIAAQTVCAALYSQAGVLEADDIGELGLGDAANIDETSIGVVLLATKARRCIARGEDVAPRWLAALAGITKRRVNQLTGNGQLKLRRSTGPRGRTAIPARAAQRLLVSRIVGDQNARTLNAINATARYCTANGTHWLVITSSDETMKQGALALLATTNGWERADKEWISRVDAFSR